METPQQNGRVKWKSHHMLNVARTLRFQASLPIKFWGECALTATYLINKTLTQLLNSKTPYEVYFVLGQMMSSLKFSGVVYIIMRPKEMFSP